MRRNIFLAAACSVAVVVGVAAQQQQQQAQPAADVVKAASDALGTSNLKTLKYTAFGANYSVGQSPSPTEGWPKVTVKSYDATINYDTQAMRVDITREQGPIPPRGGGVPFTGEQRQVQVVRGTAAWDEQPPAAGGGGGRRGGGPPPAAEAGRISLPEANLLVGIRPPGPPPPTPQPGAVVDRMVQYYLTPHGFLKGAQANNATARKVGTSNEVTFTLDGKYKFTGVINARNEVEKITTWIDNPVLGDMPIEATFMNYQKFENGVSFPLRIVQTTGGYPSLELWVSSVLPGSMADIEVPMNVASATVPPVNVTAEEIGKGIQYLKGGSHHSVAIEMRDHVILVEAPQNEARASAVVTKVKELFPNKPIRYVVNTHHHFDHSGGLRTLVAEGATVVTHSANRAFYQKAWSAPRTISPDRESQAKRPATFMPVVDRQVLTDGARTVQVLRIADNPHNDGFLVVYLPAEKLLIEADAYTPPAPPPAAGAAGPGQGGQGGQGGGQQAQGGQGAAGGRGGRAGGAPPAPVVPVISPTTKNLYDNIQRLKLDVAQIAALHGPRLATMDDLRTAITPPPAQPAAPAGPGGPGR